MADELVDPDAEYASPGEEREAIIADLADLMMLRRAVQFGSFVSPAGKPAHHQIDLDLLCDGHHAFDVGKVLAKTLVMHYGEDLNTLFSASLEALPLTVIAAQYYALLTGTATEWGYMKPIDLVNQGSGLRTRGGLLGHDKKTVVIDDILTSGEIPRMVITALREGGALVVGLCTVLDRREKRYGTVAGASIASTMKLKVACVATMGELAKKLPPDFCTEENAKNLIKDR